MNPYRRPFGVLSSPLLVSGVSVAALGLLTLLLWDPWARPGVVTAAPLRFYCAANVTKPVQAIIDDYRAKYGIEVHTSFDGSGKLLSSIDMTGGEGDLYLAADSDHIRKARKKGLIAETIPIATMRPVLAVHPDTQKELRAAGKPVTGIKDLLRDDLKVVLANPELASIGQFTVEVLGSLEWWKEIDKALTARSPRVSHVGTVVEVAGAVKKGHTLGIVWDAVADQYGLEKIPLKEFAGRTETMWIAVLARSKQPTAALQFARYLTAADRGMKMLRDAGYDTMADADDWAERPEIKLAAGAMLMPAITDAIDRFSQREGVSVSVTPAGCGILVSQMKRIKAGQSSDSFPDAYFACDTSFMDSVQQWYEKPVNVSSNDMVLIRRKGNPKGVNGLKDLARSEVRVGFCDPEKSALGELTDRLLRQLHLHQDVYQGNWQSHIHYVDAGHLLVSQMRAGALDAAVVYRSNALATPEALEKDIEVVELNEKRARATQPFAVSAESRHKYLVRRLLDTITSDASAQRFTQLGFHWQAGTR
jgi:molybdenum ABC transporter molybdate-binding protein